MSGCWARPPIEFERHGPFRRTAASAAAARLRDARGRVGSVDTQATPPTRPPVAGGSRLPRAPPGAPGRRSAGAGRAASSRALNGARRRRPESGNRRRQAGNRRPESAERRSRLLKLGGGGGDRVGSREAAPTPLLVYRAPLRSLFKTPRATRRGCRAPDALGTEGAPGLGGGPRWAGEWVGTGVERVPTRRRSRSTPRQAVVASALASATTERRM